MREITLPSGFIKSLLKEILQDCVPSDGRKMEADWQPVERDLREMAANNFVPAHLEETIIFWAQQIWDDL